MNKLAAFLFLIVFGSSIAANAQNIASFDFDAQIGSTSLHELISSEVFTINNHFNRPEFIQGVQGNALRLDGYSTWVMNESYQLPEVTDIVCLEVWYTTESFSAKNGGLISQQTSDNGFSLEVGAFGNILFHFSTNSGDYTVQSIETLTPYSWHHIVAYADLSESVAKIFLDGQQVATQQTDDATMLVFDNSAFYLGRQSNVIDVDGFLLMVANGAIDEVNIYNQILSEDQILQHYTQFNGATPDLTIDPDIRHQGDFLRPQYHPMPNTNWTNESYGLTYYNDRYHLFFQKNPNGLNLNFMHWGHISSLDMVQWAEEKVALRPSEGFDSYGVWSGTTTMDDNGEPVIVYTGVDGIKAGIGMAFPEDEALINWTEYIYNPVVSSPPSGYNHMDFRDPYVWKHDEWYYMIVGSGLSDNGGGILFSYKSQNLQDWESISPIYQNSDVDLSGTFWEMPFMYPLNETDYVLCVTPLPASNAEALYWVGSFTDEQFTPYNPIPLKMELISGNMLSPSIGTDAEGRIQYIGIIPEDRNVSEQIAAGWRHMFSIPRVIRLLDDGRTLGQTPHPNLCRLRDQHVEVLDRKIIVGQENNLQEVSGVQMELEMDLKFETESRFRVDLLKNSSLGEYTSLIFDTKQNIVVADRRKSSVNTQGAYEVASYYFNPEDSLHLQVFVDHSVVEVFIDQLLVYSFRAYPSSAESNEVDMVVTSGEVQLLNLNAWTLKDKDEEMTNDVCEPAQLPDQLFTSPISVEEMGFSSDDFKIYPNPAKDFFCISIPKELNSNLQYEIYDLMGKLISSNELTDLNSESKICIQSDDLLSDTIYMVKFSTEQGFFTKKLVIR